MCPPPPSFCWTSSEKFRRTLSPSTPGPPSPYTAGQQLLLSPKRPLGSDLTSPLPPCSNGIGRSGVFIALHILLERMVAEGLVDVFQTIKNLRIQRPAMVQTLVSLTPSLCPTIDSTFVEDVTAALPPLPSAGAVPVLLHCHSGLPRVLGPHQPAPLQHSQRHTLSEGSLQCQRAAVVTTIPRPQ